MPYRVTERGEQRRENMRRALIAAAHTLFVRQGYEATTMLQIVRSAGTSIGNCYFYFPTKESLLRAIVDDFAQYIGKSIDSAIAPLPIGPVQIAVALAQAVHATLEQADLARVLLVDTRIPELRATVLQYFIARLSYLLDVWHLADGDLPVPLVTLAWQGTTFQILESAIMGTLEEDEHTIVTFLVRWNLRALGIPEEQVKQTLLSLEDFLQQDVSDKSRKLETDR